MDTVELHLRRVYVMVSVNLTVSVSVHLIVSVNFTIILLTLKLGTSISRSYINH